MGSRTKIRVTGPDGYRKKFAFDLDEGEERLLGWASSSAQATQATQTTHATQHSTYLATHLATQPSNLKYFPQPERLANEFIKLQNKKNTLYAHSKGRDQWVAVTEKNLFRLGEYEIQILDGPGLAKEKTSTQLSGALTRGNSPNSVGHDREISLPEHAAGVELTGKVISADRISEPPVIREVPSRAPEKAPLFDRTPLLAVAAASIAVVAGYWILQSKNPQSRRPARIAKPATSSDDQRQSSTSPSSSQPSGIQSNVTGADRELAQTLAQTAEELAWGPIPANAAQADEAQVTRALFRAAAAGKIDEAKQLVESYPSAIENRSQSGGTPLMTAAYYGKVDVLRFLLSRGAQLNAIDRSGNTALHWATEGKRSDSVAILIQSGADTQIERRDGQRAVDIAKNKSFDADVIALMSNARPNTKPAATTPDQAERDVASGTKPRAQ